MENDRAARVLKTTSLHLAMEANDVLQKIEEFPDNPKAMHYFYDLYRNAYANNSVLPESDNLVGTMCVQVPDEVIRAAGARPVRLCSGAFAYDQIGAEFLPAKSCPLVKATCGMLRTNSSDWQHKLKTIVIPTTCDLKKKAGELITEMGYAVDILEMPATKESESSRYYWQESVKHFAVSLAKTMGRKITAADLKKAIKQSNQAIYLFKQLSRLRQSAVPLIFSKDVFLVSNSYFFAEIKDWLAALAELIRELEERKLHATAVTNRYAPRILFTGSPVVFPNLKVPIMVEQAGGIIVADEVCAGSRLLFDSISYDEEYLNDMIPAVADRYLKPCTCPCLTPNFDRLRRIEEMIEEYKIEGIVYQALSGCFPYEVEHQKISNGLRHHGLPVLYLETDYSPEDQGQLSTRIEAFLESIKSRRRRAE